MTLVGEIYPARITGFLHQPTKDEGIQKKKDENKGHNQLSQQCVICNDNSEVKPVKCWTQLMSFIHMEKHISVVLPSYIIALASTPRL